MLGTNFFIANPHLLNTAALQSSQTNIISHTQITPTMVNFNNQVERIKIYTDFQQNYFINKKFRTRFLKSHLLFSNSNKLCKQKTAVKNQIACL